LTFNIKNTAAIFRVSLYKNLKTFLRKTQKFILSWDKRDNHVKRDNHIWQCNISNDHACNDWSISI